MDEKKIVENREGVGKVEFQKPQLIELGSIKTITCSDGLPASPGGDPFGSPPVG